MTNRVELHNILCVLIGSRNVYFQPPESLKMNYPAIVYSLNNIENTFANNQVYVQSRAYTITVLDKDPDSEIVEKVSKIPKCRYDRHFESEGLNHDIFTLYF